MLASPIFWLLYVMFVAVSASGLTATAEIALIAKSYGVADAALWLGVSTLTIALVFDNVMNGLARPFFGWVSDVIGREYTMAIAFALGGTAYWLLDLFGTRPLAFVLFAGLIFFTWGEIFSLFPSTATDTFGPKFATANASLLYTAKGTSAFLVPFANLLAGRHEKLARRVPCGDAYQLRRGVARPVRAEAVAMATFGKEPGSRIMTKKPIRIAVLHFAHETVTFLKNDTTVEDFIYQGSPARGEGLLRWDSKSYMGGFVKVAREHDGVELTGIESPYWPKTGTGSGWITREAFEKFLGKMISAIKAERSFDGVYLCLHGAMAVRGVPRPEGARGQALAGCGFGAICSASVCPCASMAKPSAISRITGSQSPRALWRKRRAVGYQGLSSRSRSQRQSGTRGSGTKTRLPMAPAR